MPRQHIQSCANARDAESDREQRRQRFSPAIQSVDRHETDRWRDLDAQHLRSLEVDRQFELGRPLDRQIPGLGPPHPCAPQLPPSRWPRRRPHRPRRSQPTRNPPPNRRIVVPPATPGRSCSPASTPCSRSCAPTAGARCASSPSSPIPRPGRASATPTPSRHPSTRSINASPGNLDRRPPAACAAGLARASGRHAQPARTAAGAPLPRTAEKHPHNGAQPSLSPPARPRRPAMT